MKTEHSDTSSGRLSFLRPRETTRIQRAREGRMAALGQKLRFWLPLSAAAVIMMLFLWPKILPSFTLSNIAKNVPDLVIDNLHYNGVDNKNQPYSLTAAQATKPSGLRGIYDMTKPEGEITLQGGTWMDSKADYGRYDEVGKKLWLGGNVTIFQDNGNQMTTEEAQVNLKTNEAWGNKPVVIQGPFGTIRGIGFRFLDAGNVVVIQGPAKAVLGLHGNASSDKPNH